MICTFLSMLQRRYSLKEIDMNDLKNVFFFVNQLFLSTYYSICQIISKMTKRHIYSKSMNLKLGGKKYTATHLNDNGLNLAEEF